jgi:hypothetical protein
MFDDLLLHTRTRTQLEAFVKKPGHGVVLQGPLGSGKEYTAQHLAASLVGLSTPEELARYPYASIINPETPTITIDEIRAAQNLMVLKVPRGKTDIRRIIIVIDAGRMRSEAQNAFLKTLEEPPADTCIILTASGEKLLPTITSRTRSIAILPVSKSQATAYYASRGVPSIQLARQFSLSQGQAGLLSALVNDDAHALSGWVQTAKEVLTEPAGRRLLRTEALSKDKTAIRLLLDALNRIAHSALIQAASQNKQPAVDRWMRTQANVQKTVAALQYNASTKLLLDDLFLNL